MGEKEGIKSCIIKSRPLITKASIYILSVSLTLTALIWASDAPSYIGITLYTEQFIALVLGFSLALTYMMGRTRPGVKSQNNIPWYDILAAIVSLGIGVYLAIYYPVISTLAIYKPTYLVIISIFFIVLLLEALRRLVGLPLTLIVLLFILYGLFGDHLPGVLSAHSTAADRIALYLTIDPNAILGMALIVAATIIIPFIFMGQLLKSAGGSGFFTDISLALMGRYRGGPAKVAITASSLFGSISGSAVSNVATTGIITIPMMIKSGYHPRVAAGIEALASSGGQLMPPVMGAAAFLMAELLQISYGEVMLAAVIPSLLFYVALFIQAHLEAAKKDILPIEKSRIPAAYIVLKQGWHFILPFAILVVGIFKFNLRPETAVILSLIPLLISGFLIGYDKEKLKPYDLLIALNSTGKAVIEIIIICAAAGIVIGILNMSGLGFGMTMLLVEFGQGQPVVLLVSAAVVSILLGMGMPTVGVYILLATLVAPALIQTGINPVSAHLFVLYFGMLSMITPPIALAVFAAANIAKSEPMRTGLTSIKFGWSAYLIPFLFVADPALIMQGPYIDVITVTCLAILGVLMVSCGVIGYFLYQLKPLSRILFVLSGAMMLTPRHIFEHTDIIEFTGFIFCLILIALNIVQHRNNDVSQIRLDKE